MECVALDSPPSPSLQGQGLPAGLLPALPHATRVAPQLRCEFGHVSLESLPELWGRWGVRVGGMGLSGGSGAGESQSRMTLNFAGGERDGGGLSASVS